MLLDKDIVIKDGRLLNFLPNLAWQYDEGMPDNPQFSKEIIAITTTLTIRILLHYKYTKDFWLLNRLSAAEL